MPSILAPSCLWPPRLLFLRNSSISCTPYCNSFQRQHNPHQCSQYQCNHSRRCHRRTLLGPHLPLDHSSLACLLPSWPLFSLPSNKLQHSCSSSCLSFPRPSFLHSFHPFRQPSPSQRCSLKSPDLWSSCLQRWLTCKRSKLRC